MDRGPGREVNKQDNTLSSRRPHREDCTKACLGRLDNLHRWMGWLLKPQQPRVSALHRGPQGGFKSHMGAPNYRDRVEVGTNRIEGAWKHAKDHFRRINGTSMINFEAHLAVLQKKEMITKKKER